MDRANFSSDQHRVVITRRGFIAAGAALGGAAGLGCAPTRRDALVSGTYGGAPNTIASLRDNIYTRLLGVRPHLGAHEHITTLGGSRMPPAVMQAMMEANEFFVDMHELTAAAGQRVAQLMGAEGALVTAGGFDGIHLRKHGNARGRLGHRAWLPHRAPETA